MDKRESSDSGVCEHIDYFWHNSITTEERKHIVELLIKYMFPIPDLDRIALERTPDTLIAFGWRVERETYEMAGTRSEYYRVLAEKIQTVEMLIERKRRESIERQLRDQ